MSLKSLRLVQVDSMHLRTVLVGVLNMVPQKLAQSAEFSLSGVVQAEIEGLVSGGLVHDL